jgi:hypothetical protein
MRLQHAMDDLRHQMGRDLLKVGVSGWGGDGLGHSACYASGRPVIEQPIDPD